MPAVAAANSTITRTFITSAEAPQGEPSAPNRVKAPRRGTSGPIPNNTVGMGRWGNTD